jgi:hypothetical protein
MSATVSTALLGGVSVAAPTWTVTKLGRLNPPGVSGDSIF